MFISVQCDNIDVSGNLSNLNLYSYFPQYQRLSVCEIHDQYCRIQGQYRQGNVVKQILCHKWLLHKTIH